MTKGLVYGIGINDADYLTNPIVEGKTKKCKVYQTWAGMLERCYSEKSIQKYPTYMGCSVDKEWHSFMSFRDWMLKQDYESKQLDKDLLVPGNKVYSKDTCIFITSALNSFMLESTAARGSLPLGVSFTGNKFMARCNNPFTKNRTYLGSFVTPEEAHLAWKSYKHELALKYAELETDPRIINALKTRYLTETL